MPVQFRLKGVRGLTQALRKLDSIPPGFLREAGRVLTGQAGKITRDARERVRRRTGRLAKSGRVTGPELKGNRLSAGSQFGGRKTFYGRFVEEGTVNIPGQKFLSTAGEERLPDIDRKLVQALDRAIRRSG